MQIKIQGRHEDKIQKEILGILSGVDYGNKFHID
jgi:hypothetical protein